MTFAVKRARQQIARLLLVLLAGLLVVAGVGGTAALSGRLVDDGLHRIATAADPASRAATVSALSAADPAAQDQAVRAAIGRAFGGAPIEVGRIAVSEISLGTPEAVQAIAGRAAHDAGALEDGAWPTRAGDAAVLAAAAARRGWHIGDRIRLGSATAGGDVVVTVVGIWRAKDPADPVWAGNPAVGSGDSQGAAGPVLIRDADMARLGTTPTVTWTIEPAGLSARTLDAYRAGVGALTDLPEKVDPDSRSSTRIGGGLDGLLDRLTRAVTIARGTLIVPAAIILTLGAIAVTVILAALTGARREELALRRARGSSGTQIATAAAGEAASFVGAGAALALLLLVSARAGGTAAFLAAGVLVCVAGGAAGVTAVRASDPRGAGRSDAGRGILAVLLVPLAIALVIAGLAVWQLVAQRGVLAPDGSADPVASSAGAAAMLAAALAVPVLAVILAAIAERAARGSRGIMPVLPLRRIARRAGLVAVANLCLALASASVTLALGAQPLATVAERSATSAALGLDVRVSVSDSRAALPSVADTTALPSVTGATEVLHRGLVVGADTVDLVAADVAALPVPAGVRSVVVARSGAALPVAVTSSFAQRLGATTGTGFTATVQPDGARLTVRIVAILADIPGIGSAPGVLADRAGVMSAMEADTQAAVSADELWIATTDPAAVAATIRSRATDPVRILTPAAVSDAPITGTTSILLAVGAVAAALLGVLGFLAATASDRARGADERTVLRSLGLRPSRQSAGRAGEIVGIAFVAILGGVAAGLVVTAVVLPVMWGSGS